MNYKTLTLALLIGGSSIAASAQTPPPPPPPDAKMMADPYVTAAGQSDMYEIESSRIALDRSQNPAVRRYASMLIKHHQKTTAATMKAARRAGLSPMPPMPNPGAAASLDELRTAAAADFDRVYLGQQVPAHQAALDLHRSYAANGDKTPLRTTAKSAVPIVNSHLVAAEKMQDGGDHTKHKGM